MNKFLQKLKPLTEKNKRYNDIIIPTAVLTVICIVVTLALSSANLLTHKKIKALSQQAQTEAMSKLMEGDYEEVTEKLKSNEVTYHIVKENGNILGYIFKTSAKGYGGAISVMTAINIDGTVKAIEILDASGETPGLGQNVTKADWFSQFKGLKNKITVIKGGSANSQNNEINAVTGATISSKAVTNAVNTALDYAKEIIVKGDKS